MGKISDLAEKPSISVADITIDGTRDSDLEVHVSRTAPALMEGERMDGTAPETRFSEDSCVWKPSLSMTLIAMVLGYRAQSL